MPSNQSAGGDIASVAVGALLADKHETVNDCHSMRHFPLGRLVKLGTHYEGGFHWKSVSFCIGYTAGHHFARLAAIHVINWSISHRIDSMIGAVHPFSLVVVTYFVLCPFHKCLCLISLVHSPHLP